MIFTVDCNVDLSRGIRLRLQHDRSWRQLGSDRSIADDDTTLENPDEAARTAKSFEVVRHGGTSYDARHELGIVYGQTEHIATVFPRVHRRYKPRLFTKDEVRAAIASGDD